MHYFNLPDKQTANLRRQLITDTKNYLIQSPFERSHASSEAVETLDHYKEVFQSLNADCLETKDAENHQKYQYCVTMLKLLTGRFRMRMLLHDLQQIYDENLM